MQYWLYAFKYYHGNILIDKCDTLSEAKSVRDRLDPNEYEYADIVEMEWGKEPKIVSSYNFEYDRNKMVVKRKIK